MLSYVFGTVVILQTKSVANCATLCLSLKQTAIIYAMNIVILCCSQLICVARYRSIERLSTIEGAAIGSRAESHTRGCMPQQLQA